MAELPVKGITQRYSEVGTLEQVYHVKTAHSLPTWS